MKAWNGWYHVNGNTYGTWLPGDPRGWREKQHRLHVAGDYKNPPPRGSGLRLHLHSRSLLRVPPVHLNLAQRQVAGQALIGMLLREKIAVLALSMDSIHYHILARFDNKLVRSQIGRAKLHAYHILRQRWHMSKIWQRLCHISPVADRDHQIRVFRYICNHKKQGAWLWTFRDGFD